MEAMYKAQLEKQRIGYEKKIADLKKRLEEERQKLLGSAGEAQKKLQREVDELRVALEAVS